MHPDAPLRRITTWLAICGYVLVASGLPLPFGRFVPATPQSPAAKRLAGKDRSHPFPCMDKPCGCATAEQCFTNCCCDTAAETLAWAKSHAVEPAVLEALARRVTDGDLAVAKAAKSSCCSTKPPALEESCCESRSVASCEQPEASLPAEQPPESQPRTKAVTLRAMLACGGIVAEWFAVGEALPPPRADVRLATSVLEFLSPDDDSGECLRASPAAPPPRMA